VADGATCTFKNEGPREASRCIKVLYGHEESAAVVSSDRVCSQRLGAGRTASLAVRFPRRPAEQCGEGMKRCKVKVASPDAAEAVAAAWGDELAEPPVGPLTAGECREGGVHIYQLMLAYETKQAASEEEQERIEQWMKDNHDRIVDEFVQSCPKRMTRAQLHCLLKAGTREALDRCSTP
jgi:hypothetical protein